MQLSGEGIAVGAAELSGSAEVVIIGGGVMGASTAFHLAEAGVTDIVLLERDSLASGSTSKAAGGVRANFSDAINIALGKRSLAAFENFPNRPGQEIDLKQPGYLFLIDNEHDLAAFTASVALQNEMGVASSIIDVAEAKQRSPLIDPDGLVAAAFSPRDGFCTPESVVLGYASGARRHGARVFTHTAVTGIEVAGGAISAVRTSAGTIRTGTVISAAGPWSAQVGEMVGVNLPVQPLRRQIVVTGPVADLPEDLPFTIDFSTGFYFHREGPGLLMGIADKTETPGFKLDRTDAWLPLLTEAIGRRAPAILDYPITSGWAGLYEVTPDENAIIGQSGEISRLLYATGFSGHGFLMGPAVGEVLRDLYLGVAPPVDVSGFSADRFRSDGAGLRPETNII